MFTEILVLEWLFGGFSQNTTSKIFDDDNTYVVFTVCIEDNE